MSSRPLKVLQLMTDARGSLVGRDVALPVFGTAARALVAGFAQLPEPVEVHVVSCVQGPVAAPPTLAPNIYFHSLVVPKIGWLRTGYQGCIRAVRRIARRIGPDVVHAQGTERDCAISGVFSGFPSLVTIHGNMRRIARLSRAQPFSFNWITARLEAFVLPRANGVICISRHTQTEVRALARRMWVLPNAVEPAFFAVTRSPATPPRLVCIGTIGRLKNQNALIRALDALPSHPFRLVFYGEAQPGDPYGDEFLSLVRDRPWCEHGGFAGRENLREVLSQAAALLLPSLEENCPMVVLEAMAAGVPVVAARVGGVPDLIEDGVEGYLFAPERPQEITAAIERVLQDPTTAESKARAGKERARSRHAPEVIARRHLEIYRELLAGLAASRKNG